MADVIVEAIVNEIIISQTGAPGPAGPAGPTGPRGDSGGFVHGNNITAASEITPGVGNDFDVIGNSTIDYISITGYVKGDRLFFALKGTPILTNNAPGASPGFAAMRIASTPDDFQPLTSDSASVEFRFNGSTWDLIRIATY